ncbi:MAG: hypothetical protein RIC95_14510 [Vicingaceae bacterium]
MKEKVELEKADVFFREDNIVEIRLKDDIEITLEDSKRQYQLISERYPNQEVCMLIVPGEHNTMTKEVREYANKAEAKAMSKAEAVIVDNLAKRITYNFLSKFADKNMKVFDSEQKAVEWLKKEQAMIN